MANDPSATGTRQPPSLETEVQFLKGVGPRSAGVLAKLGLLTVGDVLYYLPRRHEDRRHLPPIALLQPGTHATVRGRLGEVGARPTRGGMSIVTAQLWDSSGSVTLLWFNQPWMRQKLARVEGEVVAYGHVKQANWGFEIHSPEWETIEEGEDAEEFARLIPVYPLSEGVPQKLVRRAAQSAVEQYLKYVVDPLPREVFELARLPPLAWALRNIHRPESETHWDKARRRLVFEEFLYLQLALAMRRAETHQEIGIAFPISSLTHTHGTSGTLFEDEDAPVETTADDEGPLWAEVHRMLPFTLTGDQRRVIGEVWRDMESPHPMNRLVQGDVGSGKTAVAACAMLAAVRCGYQAAMMAPTEILAEQHATNLRRLFDPLGIEVALLVGKQTAALKRKQRDRTASGEARIAVGTHALIQEGVGFAKLGLVIVDEQHRFGVLQRAALREKGLGNPDTLVMTATPIPRTLTMTLYGDLDLSIIREMPPGRKPIKTHWRPPHERAEVYDAVRKLIENGRQAYFVCPLVGESEKLTVQAAEDLYYRLGKLVYPDLRVGLLHGQMKTKEKEEAMETFRRGDLDVLVSTTVIEVGVDVPNATVMVIEDANRFGLAQLHQLRGRVGRGDAQSYCVLIADATTDDARVRMQVMTETTDGFRIAEEDLQLRGPGELAGTKQSGNLDFKIADLTTDGEMLEVARQAAIRLVSDDPALSRPEHARMLPKVTARRGIMANIPIS
ncbi:MAG: ATP-dependent DNA helicase RecG [Fimbriimonadaceae bacterium]|nr:ATP-dependent DNA helicase RecG [Fimbriimonadaceae bacterium]